MTEETRTGTLTLAAAHSSIEQGASDKDSSPLNSFRTSFSVVWGPSFLMATDWQPLEICDGKPMDRAPIGEPASARSDRRKEA